MSQTETGSNYNQSMEPMSEDLENMSQEVDGTREVKLGSDEELTVTPVFVVQFLYMLGLALSAPNYPFIWTTLPWCGGDDVCGASLSTFGVFANAFAEFLSASLLGVMSDRYGRKPFLILASVGQIIDFTTAGLAAFSPAYVPTISAEAKPAIWLLSARVVAGFCGNLTIFTKAYVGDLSTAKTSSRNFALLFSCITAAFLMGAPLGGLLSKRGMRPPMMIASALNLLSMFLIMFWMKESLRPQHRRPVAWRKANPVGALRFLLSSRFLLLFGGMTFLDQFSLSLLHHVFFQYCKIVFKVGKGSSISLIITFSVAAIVSLGVIQCPGLLKRFGEISILRFGYVLTCAAFACLALVSYTKVFLLMFPCMLLLSMGMVSGPVQNAVATRCVGDDQQGALQAANGSLDVIGKMVSAGMASGLLRPVMSIDQPGIIWWIACLTSTGGVWAAWNLPRFLPATFRAFPSSPSASGEA